MTWLKKGQEILGYEIRSPNAQGILSTFHYHKNCFQASEEGDDITNFITKEDIEKEKGLVLMCDSCGEEIKPLG